MIKVTYKISNWSLSFKVLLVNCNKRIRENWYSQHRVSDGENVMQVQGNSVLTRLEMPSQTSVFSIAFAINFISLQAMHAKSY